jgi:hypothetical protein
MRRAARVALLVVGLFVAATISGAVAQAAEPDGPVCGRVAGVWVCI